MRAIACSRRFRGNNGDCNSQSLAVHRYQTSFALLSTWQNWELSYSPRHGENFSSAARPDAATFIGAGCTIGVASLPIALKAHGQRRQHTTALYFGLALTVVVLTFSNNPVLALLALANLFASIKLLWRPGESPILVFVFIYQWLQVNIKILHADLLRVSVEDLAAYGGDVTMVVILSNAALLALACGMNRGAGPRAWLAVQEARAQSLVLPMKVWVRLYVVAWVLSAIATALIPLLPGLSQVLLVISGLRWVFFFALTYAAFSRPSVWLPWWLIFLGEYLLSLGGFFSDFRVGLFFAIFAVTAATAGRMTWTRAASLLLLTALLVASALVWSAVKGEYRAFVNQGSGQQVVAVDRTDQLAKLQDLVAQLDSGSVAIALETMVVRMSYVDFFARVMAVVPARTAHTRGDIWGDALLRIVTPRLLFPEKSGVNDSDRTNQFTGLNVSTAAQGTSISIGYVAESYIDFGVEGMLFPMLAMGFGMGRFYRFAHSDPRFQGLLGMAFASVALMPAFAFESSITKVLPSLALSMLLSWMLLVFAMPRLMRWSIQPAGRAVRHSPAQGSYR